MKASEIRVGGLYVAKVSNNLTTVRVDGIDKVPSYRMNSRLSAEKTVYRVTNLKTGRKTTFSSAAKFRRAVVSGESTTGPKSVRGTVQNPLGRKAAFETPTPSVVVENMPCEQSDECKDAGSNPGEQCEHCGGIVVPDYVQKDIDAIAAAKKREEQEAGEAKNGMPDHLPGEAENRPDPTQGGNASRAVRSRPITPVQSADNTTTIPNAPRASYAGKTIATVTTPSQDSLPVAPATKGKVLDSFDFGGSKKCQTLTKTPISPRANIAADNTQQTPVSAMVRPFMTSTPKHSGTMNDGATGNSGNGKSLGDRLRSSQPVPVRSFNPPHLIVQARAGTGKTTTGVEGLKEMMGTRSDLVPSPQQQAIWDAFKESKGAGSVCFTAFGKDIADELEMRVPKNVDAMTTHRMGFRAVRNCFKIKGGRDGVNGYRCTNIAADLMGYSGNGKTFSKDNPEISQGVDALCGLVKQTLSDTTPEALTALDRHYDLDISGKHRERIFELVPQVLERCKDVNRDQCVDFNDMIWLPLALNLPVRKYDFLIVDEAQDLNRARQEICKRAGKRLVLFGDPKQAIFGFAGADAESMARMERDLANDGNRDGKIFMPSSGCLTLPLTVTRRCGKAIVEEARKIVPDFEAHPSNPVGSVSEALYTLRPKGKAAFGLGTSEESRERPYAETYMPRVQPNDMILCRVNAPLVSQCFRFLKMGRPAVILGREIGAGLISTIKKQHANSVADLMGKLDDWLQKETEKEQARKQPNENRIISMQDRVDCIICFCEGASTVDQVISKIESVFSEGKQKGTIRLSSIHKAKGLEAEQVFFLMPEGGECPHPMARSAWQREQEMNLLYVGITRAIKSLVFVRP